MDGHSIVIIARSGDAPALQRFLAQDGTVQVFSDSESIRAFDVILERPPKVLILDPIFVATARGASMVARIRAEPHLAAIQIRVLAEDEDHMLAILAHPVMGSEPAALKGSLPLEQCGTRDATRIPIRGRVDALIDGDPAELINLSQTGAQMVVRTRMRPDQAVRMTLRDGVIQVRCRAVVAWSSVEPAGATVQYRVGVTFVDPDLETILALCARHGTRPDLPPGLE